MTFHEFCSARLSESVAMMGETVTINGSPYKAVVTDLEASEDAEAGGFRPGYAATVYARKTAFPVPFLGQKMIVRGKEVRVKVISTDAISHKITVDDLAR
jgi:hypothetical protein